MKKGIVCLLALLVAWSACAWAAGRQVAFEGQRGRVLAPAGSAEVAAEAATDAEAAPAERRDGVRRIAVVPFLDNSEQHKGYIKEAVDVDYTFYFEAAGYDVVPTAETARALADAGFDADNRIVPEKEMLAEVAQATGADYVVAMSIEDIDATRHFSYFSTKIHATTRLRYNFYIASKNRMIPFQTTGEENNHAVIIGDVSHKDTIVPALEQAMDRANAKIRSYIAADTEAAA